VWFPPLSNISKPIIRLTLCLLVVRLAVPNTLAYNKDVYVAQNTALHTAPCCNMILFVENLVQTTFRFSPVQCDQKTERHHAECHREEGEEWGGGGRVHRQEIE